MANGLRIAHLDFSREWRGGQQQLLLLARQLRRLGCEQVVVALGGETARRLRAAGLEVIKPGAAARSALAPADVVHAHDGHAHSYMLRAGWRQPALQVLSRRVAFPIRGWTSRWKYRRLGLAIAVSGSVRQQVLATGLDPKRVVVIPDGLDFDDLPDAAAARKRLRPRTEEERWLVCLGAFTPEKGVADLIAAMPALPPDCHLILPGDGSARTALERQAAGLGLRERVRFVAGLAATAAEWVAAADIFVMPSRQEGLGSAALLALALRRPVVATRAGGIPELIEDGATGLLAAPGDPAALARACAELLHDRGLAARLTEAGYTRARQSYAIGQLAAATLDAYHRGRKTG